MDTPIITSKLDNDWYKFTMSYAAHECGLGFTLVTYKTIIRNKNIDLWSLINFSEFKEQIDHLFYDLKFTEDDLTYLDSYFPKRWLTQDKLTTWSMDTDDLGRRVPVFYGPWEHAILFECQVMAIITEMIGNKVTQLVRSDILNNQIAKKFNEIDQILYRPSISIIEFGTRRRFSKKHQELVLDFMKSKRDVLTSNVYLSKNIQRVPQGTIAHEWDMFFVARVVAKLRTEKALGQSSRCSNEVRLAFIEAKRKWIEVHKLGKTVWLPDTYGTKYFFDVMSQEMLTGCAGFRQDSGDPMKVLGFLNWCANKDQILVPSDGLTPKIINQILGSFLNREIVYGWGSFLTNDLISPPISLVVKLDEVDGEKTVKLSDNPAKAIGPKELITQYKQWFNYIEQEESEVMF